MDTKDNFTEWFHRWVIDSNINAVLTFLCFRRVHYDPIEYPLREAFDLRSINPKDKALIINLAHKAFAERYFNFSFAYDVEVTLTALLISCDLFKILE